MGKAFQHTRLNEAEAWRLYGLGKSDIEIAAACGVHKNTVLGWRQRNMLKAKPQRKNKLTQLELDAIEARKMGLTYGQYKTQQALTGGKKK